MSKKWEICIPSYHGRDNWREVSAYDEEDAAREAGKEYNEDDCALMNDSIFVLVRQVDSEEVVLCSASAEPDVHYSACKCRAIICRQCERDVKEDILSGKIDKLYDNRFCNRDCYQNYLEDYRKKNNLNSPE